MLNGAFYAWNPLSMEFFLYIFFSLFMISKCTALISRKKKRCQINIRMLSHLNSYTYIFLHKISIVFTFYHDFEINQQITIISNKLPLSFKLHPSKSNTSKYLLICERTIWEKTIHIVFIPRSKMYILMFHIILVRKGKIIEKHAHFPKGKQHYGISVKKNFCVLMPFKSSDNNNDNNNNYEKVGGTND